ncbi:hypothetical protein AVEN_239830-1, partial [Araneus ventricosus]
MEPFLRGRSPIQFPYLFIWHLEDCVQSNVETPVAQKWPIWCHGTTSSWKITNTVSITFYMASGGLCPEQRSNSRCTEMGDLVSWNHFFVEDHQY